MIALLRESPLLLLFVVASIGYFVGRVRVGGISLGVAAVLFVGLGASALDSKLSLPEVVPQLGLTLFVYTLGLASGPGFFASFQKRGLRDAAIVLATLAVGALIAAGAHFAFGVSASTAAGVFAGALTNTPALAAVMQQLRASGIEAGSPALVAPVVGYSVAYPLGVLGAIAAIAIADRLQTKPDGATVTPSLRPPAERRITSRTVRVTQKEAIGKPAEALMKHNGWDVILGRLRRGDAISLVDDLTVLQAEDHLTIVGPEDEVARVTTALGEAAAESLELDRSIIDYRRVFVTNPKIVGRPIRELGLQQKFGAIVTRVRRGDVELLAEEDMILEAGDRVRVVAPRERLDELSSFFGDSYKAIAEIDVLTFGFGVAIGIAIGEIPIPLPGGVTFRLGAAGGPLIAGLVLGRLGRTGPLTWSLPYSANLTLRQLGLVLFLAGVGTRSGSTFAATIAQGGALHLFALGAAITILVAAAILVIGRRTRIPIPILAGMIAGIHTQPAALMFANERTKSEASNMGYTAVFPLATIVKIVFAQLLVMLLR